MPKREVIDTARAPHTGLPYAQALRYGDLVFVAGQVALDPKTNQPSGGDVAAQTRRVLDNISAILQQAGTSLAYALDSLVFLRSASDFDAFNDAYRAYFPKDGPPRTTVQAAVPREGFLVEIRILRAMHRCVRNSSGEVWSARVLETECWSVGRREAQRGRPFFRFSPELASEATAGIEPAMKVLQTSALEATPRCWAQVATPEVSMHRSSRETGGGD